MARACPFRKESTFKIGIQQTCLHLLTHWRIYQINKWKQATESIPESSVGKHISWTDFTIIGAVMHSFPLTVYFVKHTRKQHRTIQTRVERTHTVLIAVFNLDTPQDIVPCLTTGLFCLFKGLITNFFQVQFSLFRTDEWGCHLCMYLFSFLRWKSDSSTHVIGL